jgi:hypothetical protein
MGVFVALRSSLLILVIFCFSSVLVIPKYTHHHVNKELHETAKGLMVISLTSFLIYNLILILYSII